MPAMMPALGSPGFYPLRLLRAPALRIVSRSPGVTVLAVDGLVCRLCAARTRVALAAVPGVEGASVDLASGLVELRHRGATGPQLDCVSRALDGVVVARAARRALAALVAWRPSATGEAR